MASSKQKLPAVREDWPMFRGDSARTGAGPLGGSRLVLAWSYCTGGAVFSSPAIHNGVAYIASTDRSVSALDMQHTQRLWQFQADTAVYSSPLVTSQSLYFGTTGGTFYALNTVTGQPRWQTHVGQEGSNIWSSPVLINNLILFGIASSLNEQPKVPGQVVALDAATGQMRWHTYILPGASPGGGVWSSPAVDEVRGMVFVGTGDPDDGVQALRLSDGLLLWHWRSVVRDVNDTDVGAGPLLFADRQGRELVVVGGKDGWLYALLATNGQQVWRMHLANQVFGSPAYMGYVLYAVGTNNGQVTCQALDVESGHVLWQRTFAQKGYSSPGVAGNLLYLGLGNGFGPGNGGIVVMEASTGKLLQQINLQTTASSSPALVSGWLLFGANDGNVYAFLRT